MREKRKKRSRDPERTRARILDAAFWEIYRNGFQGVSIDQIIKKTDLTKGAFFHYFPTKNDLGYAIVDELFSEILMDRWIRPLAAYQNPLKGILARFKKLTVGSPDLDIVRGCPVNNLAQEMSGVDPVFREKLQAVMGLWVDETEKYLKKAKKEGHLKKKVNTRQLAEFIVALQEGAYGMAKALNDRNLFQSLYNSLRDHLAFKSKTKV
jgi:AcrR family transcriptional regulator